MYQFIKTFLRYSDLYNIKPNFDEFINEIKRYKLTSWLNILSSFNIYLTYNDYFRLEIQNKLIKDTFSEKVCKKIIDCLSNSNEKFLFFPDQTVKIAILVLMFCDDNSTIEFKNNTDIEKFGLFLLKLNDFIEDFDEEKYEKLDEKTEEDYLRDYVTIKYYLGSTQTLKYLITRYYLIYKEIPQQNINFRTKINISNKFKEITGLEVEEYLAICFAFLSQWIHLPGERPKNTIVNKDKFFEKTNLQMSKIDRVINQICSNINNIKEQIIEVYDNTEDLDYTAILLRNKPLIKLQNNNLICIDQRYFHEKFTESIYWILLDNLNEEEGEEFLNFFGEVYEYYICDIFKSIFGNRYYKFSYDNREASDCIVEYPETVIFFEIKSSRPVRTTKDGQFKLKVDEVFLRAIKQLDKTIKDFREEKFDIDGRGYKDFKYIFPILVTLKSFPRDFLSIKYLNELIVRNGYFNEQKIKYAKESQIENNIYMNVIDAEEIEMLESLCKKFCFLDILERKNIDEYYKYQPLKNYLIAKSNKDDRVNQRLDKKYIEIYEIFKKILFNQND